MTIIAPVILSGGSGTRLWPVSTAEAPKQFQPLTGGDSMFRHTVERASDRTRFAAPLVRLQRRDGLWREERCAVGTGVHVLGEATPAG